MRTSTVVIATDFSDGAAAALERACFIAQVTEAPMVLLHVCGSPPAFLDQVGPPTARQVALGELAALRRSTGARRLEEAHRALAERSIAARTELREGPAAKVIAGAARELGARLIVTGARGTGEHGLFIIGSVAEGVTRRAYANVLVVRGPRTHGPFRRILIATDLTEASKAVVPAAVDLAGSDAEVELMHVVDWGDHPPPIQGPHGGPDLKALWSTTVREAERELDALAGRVGRGGANLSYRVVEGSAAAQIVAHARSGAHDLIVVGKHDEQPPTHASVSERVVRHAPCSVLVARRGS